MAPLNVGLIGYGFSTKSFHLPFIVPNPDLKVYAFLQRADAPKEKVEKGKHCTVDYPEAKHYQTPDDFFNDANIDLVIVCSRHDSHAEYAERSLKSGKHVVVEKCFTVTTEEADRVLETAKGSDKILTIYQNRRYDSDFLTLQDLVARKAFGSITEAEIHYDVDFPFWMSSWKSPDYVAGAGMMFGLGSHTIDQALTLFGRPASVTGVYRSLRGVRSKTDDTFTILLQYPDPEPLVVTVKTTVVATMVHPLKFFVRGYDGTFLKFGDDPQESQVAAGLEATAEGFGQEKEDTYGTLTTKEKFLDTQTKDKRSGKWSGKVPSIRGSYCDFYVDLVKAIRGEKKLVVDPVQSRDGIRIIELARESAEAGKTLKFE